MKSYTLAAAAELDLNAIWEYIADDSPDIADYWIAKLFTTFEMLATMPGMGHSRQELTSLPVLFWPVGSYIIIYRVKQEQTQIVAVTQASRDIPTFLRQRRFQGLS